MPPTPRRFLTLFNADTNMPVVTYAIDDTEATAVVSDDDVLECVERHYGGAVGPDVSARRWVCHTTPHNAATGTVVGDPDAIAILDEHWATDKDE